MTALYLMLFNKQKVIMMKILITLILLLNSLVFADTYPKGKPINFIVGLGEGGSADRMTRNMALFLEKELGTSIKIINKKKNASLDAANYVLNQAHDGYTIFSSTFSPYLPNTILSGKAKYVLDDFDVINLQWFEYDFIAVNKNSKFNSLIELIDEIKNGDKKLSASVIYKSSGHLLIKLLLEKLNIPQNKLELKFFNGGKDARNALLTSKTDLLVIAAQGSEKYRNEIKPLALASSKRSKRWDSPTLNEILKDIGVQIPYINGPIRGIAVSKEFKQNFPLRYKILEKAIKKTLSKRRVQKLLKQKNIGYSWTGSEKSSEILEDSYNLFKTYYYLLED